MTSKRMLIDAIHPEETRVAVMSDHRLEDFEVEAADRKQLKGNIYLAKITRVEPSLQAAFVEYGGNRHGFLAFSEIHPDYYQIPVSDREKLMAEQKAAERAAQEAEDADAEAGQGKRGRKRKAEGAEGEGEVETIEGEEGEEADVRRPTPAYRNYKIQEVIKRRQIMLVQVVKEERGSKGAALTTYLSLAGRYCVLMPNTARGGGISRKISNAKDRTRLKSILKELEIPEGMAVIVRTAGAERSKTEVKRDCTYLLRLWESVRSLTLESIAPTLVYEEGNLIKRTIRDLYANDFEEIIVDGEEGYQTARNFMRLLMPSHAKRVKPHPPEAVPLFQYYKADQQLHGIYNPDVSLPSGGYIVINPTEALVSIDVNSGRATRERNIEETALRTNLEAADEVARQLRLRELAGLIVIDFIDMDNPRNQAQVERRLKTAMRHDRARIQIGRISPFGLLELSRQRLHPSLFETSFEPVPHSTGVGYRRTVASAALATLRALEHEGEQGRARELQVQTPTSVALYILNHKRGILSAIEQRHKVSITFKPDDSLTPPELRIERLRGAEPVVAEVREARETREVPEPVESAEEEVGGDGTRRRRRRRRRGRRPDEHEESQEGVEALSDAQADEDMDEADTASDEEADEAETEAETQSDAEAEERTAEDADGRGRRRRRGRRGGRRRGREGAEDRAMEDVAAESEPHVEEASTVEAGTEPEAEESTAGRPEDEGEKRPRRRRRRGRGTRSSEMPREAAEASQGDNAEEATEALEAGAELLPLPAPDASPAEAVPAPVSPAVRSEEAMTESPWAPKPEEPVGTWSAAEPTEATEEAAEEAPAQETAGNGAGQPGEGGAGGEDLVQDNVLVRTKIVGEQPGEDQPRRRGWWQRLIR